MNDFFLSVSDHLPRLDKDDNVFTVHEELPAEFIISVRVGGQVQLVKYSNTSSTRNQVQVQVQVLCIFTNQVLKYIKY